MPRPTAPEPPAGGEREQRLFLPRRTHWSDRLAVAAVVVDHEVVARAEVEAPRVVRVAGVERTRPVVAVAACAAEEAIDTGAGSGQEETVAVGSGEESSIHTVLLCPGDGRVVVELLKLFLGGHAPVSAPVGHGRVVSRLQGGQVVGEAIIAVAGAVTVLGQRVRAAVAVLVSAPIIDILWLRLAPGEVVAVVLRGFGAHVASGLQQAARQAEVDIGVAIVSATAVVSTIPSIVISSVARVFRA